MVEHYLGQMIAGWFCDHDVEAESLEEYEADAVGMLKHIQKHGDKNYSKLAFAYLITSENISPKTWDYLEDCWNYSFVEYEFKEIVEYAYRIIWPDTPPEEALKGYQVKFIKTGIDPTVWWSTRDELNPSFNETN